MSAHESRVTARVDAVLYNKVQQHFHYGQQTKLLRNVYDSIQQLIEEGKFDEVTDYLYKGKALMLPSVEE
jgi:maltose-binding protein MalE